MFIVQYWNGHLADWLTINRFDDYEKTQRSKELIESLYMECRIVDCDTAEIVYETGECDED